MAEIPHHFLLLLSWLASSNLSISFYLELHISLLNQCGACVCSKENEKGRGIVERKKERGCDMLEIRGGHGLDQAGFEGF
jgi:hypothetical protein